MTPFATSAATIPPVTPTRWGRRRDSTWLLPVKTLQTELLGNEDVWTALSYRTYPRRPSGSTIGTILIPAGAGPLPYIIGCNKNVDRDND
ncbi:Os10g0151900 [Oryza sativa Japonica Group]|uniref:Os10g0151900 protein n=1 Tax=Oryza sativa subsp. japonica TaxID=39947 RepID=Q0IYW9_ORYSJ|nr:Os10g0151900 [Oryza sativa Japonica Group]|eukprot:NP_001064182.1 Os10g0151900 [Oryza sativa Japonica Group]